MTPPALDLSLPAPERRLAATLAGAWRDFLYAPGEGFTSPLDPGAYRSTFVVIPVDGVAVRLSSLLVPAFGGDLCRLRLEPIERYRSESLGSFFEPSRTGTVYSLTPDRSAGAARAPARAEWRYEGPALGSRLGSPGRVRLLRERARGADCAWQADRGLVLTGADGGESLFLSVAEQSEAVLFVASPGLYRALVDPVTTPPPGVTASDLLGYGDWPGGLEIGIELLPV